MSEYFEALCGAMAQLAEDRQVRVVGYGVRQGASRTWHAFQEYQLMEMPVAEGLMAGVACGLALQGYRPVVWFERFDFVLNAMDTIVNHIDKLELLSRGQFRPGVMFRVAVGNQDRPLYTGPVHTQNLVAMMRQAVGFEVWEASRAEDVVTLWDRAYTRCVHGQSTMVVDYRDRW